MDAVLSVMILPMMIGTSELLLIGALVLASVRWQEVAGNDAWSWTGRSQFQGWHERGKQGGGF